MKSLPNYALDPPLASFRHIILGKAVIKTKPKKLAVTVGNDRENQSTTQAKSKHPFQRKNIKKPQGNNGQNPEGTDQGVTHRYASQKEPVLPTIVFQFADRAGIPPHKCSIQYLTLPTTWAFIGYSALQVEDVHQNTPYVLPCKLRFF